MRERGAWLITTTDRPINAALATNRIQDSKAGSSKRRLSGRMLHPALEKPRSMGEQIFWF